jgi:streptogramin lyase
MRRTTPSGQVTEFATELPPGFDTPEFYQFVFGPDRNIWYAAGGPGIYRMTLTGDLSRYEVSPTSAPFAITVGPDGRLWFVDLSSAVHPIVGAFRPPVR